MKQEDKIQLLMKAPYFLKQEEADSLVALKEGQPKLYRAMEKFLQVHLRLVVQRFKKTNRTDDLLREQGSYRALNKVIEDLQQITEVR